MKISNLNLIIDKKQKFCCVLLGFYVIHLNRAMIIHTIWYYIYFLKKMWVSKYKNMNIFKFYAWKIWNTCFEERRNTYKLSNYKKLNEKCFTEIKIKLIKKEGINVPVQELSFLIFGPNQQGSTFLMYTV